MIKLPKQQTSSFNASADSPTSSTLHTDPVEGLSAPVEVPAAGSVSTKSVSKRRFIPGWTTSFPWILYDSTNDIVLCSTCREIFHTMGLPFSSKKETIFIELGFSNWKKGVEKFKLHEQSMCHKEAVVKLHALKASVNVCAQLSDQKKKEMMVNRACLKKIFSSLLYLASQGLAIRGCNDDTSNFVNLLNLRSEDTLELKSWLKRESYTWCSHGIQNEILDLLSHTLLRKLLAMVREAVIYAIMCDETADVSRKEQFSFCIRFTIKPLEAEEIFLGFYEVENTTAASLYSVIKDILIRFDLPLSNCRGQCYDGARNMAGGKNGVQAKILGDERKALFVHCLAHSLNLVAQDAIKTIPVCRDTLNLVKDLINFVRDSPKRLAMFQSLKSNDSTKLRPLCPTRWAVKYVSMSSVLSNYSALMQFFTTLADSDASDAGAKAAGFLRMMEKFDFYFTLKVLVKLFGYIDTVNTALQRKSLRLEEAYRMIDTLKASLNFCKREFSSVWENISTGKPAEVGSPKLPRKRRVPKRFDADDQPQKAESVEEIHVTQYQEIIDNILESLDSRFQTESFEFILEIEQFLLGDDANKTKILHFYEGDIDSERLLLHREMFSQILKEANKTVENISDIIEYFKKEPHLVQLLPEFVKFLNIVVTIPTSSATPERSFSGLRRLKTYLRSTMGQQRLNSVAILHFHKDMAKDLNMDEVVNEFISRNSQRKNTFYM